MNRVEFCSMLASQRKAQNFSAYSMCKAMGLQYNNFNRIERGVNSMKISKIFQYLAVLGCSLHLQGEKPGVILCNDDFIDWLVKARDGKFSQRTLAETIGRSYMCVAHAETQKSILTCDSFLRIVDALGYQIAIIKDVR